MQTLDEKRLKECFALSTQSMEYLTENYDDLAKKHDKKWVAVLDGKVVEEASSLEKLNQALRKHKHPECMVVEYLTTEPMAMFF